MDSYRKIHYLFYNLQRKLCSLMGHDMALFDLDLTLQVIAFILLGFEFGMKMYSVRYSGHIMVSNVDKIISIYAANTVDVTHDRSKLLQTFSTITEIFLKCGLLLYFLAGCFYLLNPIYLYLVEDKIVPILPIYMPFIDATTCTGFTLLIVIHLGFMFIAVVASASTDFMFFMTTVNFFVPANIFRDNVRDLSTELMKDKVDFKLLKAKFLNILLIHREICKLIADMDQTFNRISSVQIFCSTLSAAVEIFICLQIEFFPAIGFAVTLVVQIIGFCAIGTIIEICNDMMLESIMMANWYLMPCSDQKLYQFLMMNMQKTKTFTIGGIAPLNLISGVSILRSIYTFIMCLLNFVG